jgi:hypothetical protein
MKWMKQVFAQRFNGMDGRIGHIWGDRYWSEILDGEPPEGENAGVRALVGEPSEEGDTGVRPLAGEPPEEGNTGVRPRYEEGTIGVRPRYEEAAETGWFLLFFLPNPPLCPHSVTLRPG